MGDRFQIQLGLIAFSFIVSCLAFAVRSNEKDSFKLDETFAREQLANLVLSQINSPDAATRQLSNSQQFTNSLDGNSYLSPTTYHDYVFDYCVEWFRKDKLSPCKRWLDPYVSSHGLESGDDKSPLENLIATAWKKFSKTVDEVMKESRQGELKEYSIWEIEAQDPGPVIRDVPGKRGTLDRNKLGKFKLRKELEDEVKDLGRKSGEQNLDSMIVYDENAPKPEGDPREGLHPNEGFRARAAALTQAMRNRLVSLIGANRAAQPGIEIEISENLPDCRFAADVLKKDRFGQAGLTNSSFNRFDPLGSISEQQIKDCEEAISQSVYAATKASNGSPLSRGDDQVDLWRLKLNVAAIDFPGVDVRQLDTRGVKLDEDELKSDVVEYKEGGLEFTRVRETNAETLNSYNEELDKAANAVRELASINPFIEDKSEQIRKAKINPNAPGLDAITLNGLTPEMLEELQNTKLAKERIYKQDKAVSTEQVAPEKFLETNLSQLVVNKVQ